jgi:hypothetical protein
MMDNNVKIVKIFQHSVFGTSEETYGYWKAQVVYALYEDQTWEKILVFDGDYYKSKQNAKLQISSRLQNRTRGEAIEIIKNKIYDCSLVGRLLV